MIITVKKPLPELLEMLGGAKKVAIVGCDSCAAACRTGGAPEIDQMAQALEDRGFQVVARVLPQECCHKLLVRKELKVLPDTGVEAVVCLACGSGVQTVADNVCLPVYPANDTSFLGQVERVGIFHEYCRMCGQCVLGRTGGICPVTRCAKGLVDGPCGGQKNGKCEVDPENDCAWIAIYERLKALGREDLLFSPAPIRDHSAQAHPKHLDLRGTKP